MRWKALFTWSQFLFIHYKTNHTFFIKFSVYTKPPKNYSFSSNYPVCANHLTFQLLHVNSSWQKITLLWAKSQKDTHYWALLMGDYWYTELSCKLPPLFRAPAVWVVPVWLTHRLMWEWCHYNKNIFNTFQLSVPVAVNITWDNNATCKAVSFYIRGFIYTSSYSSPHQTDGRVVYMISHFMTRCIS